METITTQRVLFVITSLSWIYRELMKEIKILELLSDADIFAHLFM